SASAVRAQMRHAATSRSIFGTVFAMRLCAPPRGLACPGCALPEFSSSIVSRSRHEIGRSFTPKGARRKAWRRRRDGGYMEPRSGWLTPHPVLLPQGEKGRLRNRCDLPPSPLAGEGWGEGEATHSAVCYYRAVSVPVLKIAAAHLAGEFEMRALFAIACAVLISAVSVPASAHRPCPASRCALAHGYPGPRLP